MGSRPGAPQPRADPRRERERVQPPGCGGAEGAAGVAGEVEAGERLCSMCREGAASP